MRATLPESDIGRVTVSIRTAFALVVCLTLGTGHSTHGGSLKPQGKGDPNATASRVRTDRYGDPLPYGALTRLGTVRFRHGVIVQAVVFSPDGKTLASGGAFTWGVCLWESATGRPLHRIPNPRFARYLAFSPDGKQLFTSDNLRAIDVATGKELRRRPPGRQYALAIALSSNGRVLAATDGRNVTLLEAATFRQLRQLSGQGAELWSLAFAPDGQTLAAGCFDRVVRLWDLSGGAGPRRLEGHRGEIYSVAFAPRGKMLASAGEDKTIRLWDARTGKELHQLKGHSQGVNAVAFAPDGKTLASGGNDGTVRIWDPATGKELRRWEGATVAVSAVRFSPDGKRLATCGTLDHAIRLWDPATGKEVRPTAGHTGQVEWVRFAPDGKALLSAGRDRQVMEWDPASGTGRKLLRGRSWPPGGGYWHALALSPDGKVLAVARTLLPVGKADPAIRLWDTGTGKELHALHGHRGAVRSLTFSPDGRTLASGGEDGSIRLWDAGTGKKVRRLEQPPEVWVVIFAPDGRTLASKGADGWLGRLARGKFAMTALWTALTAAACGLLDNKSPVLQEVLGFLQKGAK